jgi:hypothetical protein
VTLSDAAGHTGTGTSVARKRLRTGEKGRESPRGRLEDAGASKGLQRMKLKRKVAVARATSPVHYLASDSFAEKYEKLTYERKQIICDENMRILAEREGRADMKRPR